MQNFKAKKSEYVFGYFMLALKNHHTQSGLSYDEIALATENSPATIGRWIRGETFPKSIPAIKALVSYLRKVGALK